jgi:Immunoglobulin-like domain of bacterial spore germination
MTRQYMAWLLAVILLAGCVQPVSTPTASPSGLDAPQTIVVDAPPISATITSPLVIRGSTAVIPIAGTLTYRIFDRQESLVGRGTLPVLGPPEGPGQYDGPASYETSESGPGRIEVLELNPADGSVRAVTSVSVVLMQTAAGAGATPLATATAAITPIAEGGTAVPFVTAVAPSPSAAGQTITIQSPPTGTIVGSPVTLTGTVTQFPVNGQISFIVRDEGGRQIGAGSFPVSPTGSGANFAASLTFAEPPGGGVISVELSDPERSVATIQLRVSPPQAITFETPPTGTTVGSPMTITGQTARYPFQGALSYRVFDSSNRSLGSGLVLVQGEPGRPGRFASEVTFALPQGGGDVRVELSDEDAVTGVVAARQSLVVRVDPQSLPPGATVNPLPPTLAIPPGLTPVVTPGVGPTLSAITIEQPVALATVSSPVTLSGRISSTPQSAQLRYRVRDAAGRLIGEGGLPVTGAAGQPGTFSGAVVFSMVQEGPIVLEVLDLDASGAVRASALLIVQSRGPLPASQPPQPPAYPAP